METDALTFSYQEIKEKGGLECIIKPDIAVFRKLLEIPDKITELEVEVKFSVGTDSILAEGEAKGMWEVECSRCLAPFSSRFEGSFDETYSESAESIDITDTACQAVILCMEVKWLCMENCKGLCPICGQNLNKHSCGCKIEKKSPFSVLKNLKKDT